MKRDSFFTFAVMIVMIASIFTVSAAEVWTSDIFGNEKEDFSSGEIVVVHGEGFESSSAVFVDVENPDSADYGATITNSEGEFTYYHELGAPPGGRVVSAQDGASEAEATFNVADIWLTKDGCGNIGMSEFVFGPSDTIFINGEGFFAGNYNWSVAGTNYSTSCDPGIIVASGVESVNASGSFCLEAYTIRDNDCGFYEVRFGNKIDYVKIDGGECEGDEDCGETTSQLVCERNSVANLTTIPGCSDSTCEYRNESDFVQDCGETTSELRCLGDNSANYTYIRGCAGGGCFNATSILVLECPFGCSDGVCNERAAVRPLFECVIDLGNGNFEAFFGYVNTNPFNVDISIGSQNRFTPAPINRGQPTTFLPGQTLPYPNSSFSVISNVALVWSLDGLNATALPPALTNRICPSICGNGIVESGEECDGGELCNDKCEICEDDDLDKVCNEDDDCPDSRPGEPVDKEGCDPFQFCSQFSCGFDCWMADFRNNEDARYPHDCTVVEKLGNGIVLRPVCVPTVVSEFCSG